MKLFSLLDQPGDHVGGFLDLEEAAAGDAAQHVVDELGLELVEDAGLGGRRGDRVDGDVVLGALLADRLGHADDAGLGGGVGGGVGVALLAGDRGDVDDAAVVAGLHAGQHGAVDVEGAVEVDLDDAAPLVEVVLVERARSCRRCRPS